MSIRKDSRNDAESAARASGVNRILNLSERRRLRYALRVASPASYRLRTRTGITFRLRANRFDARIFREVWLWQVYTRGFGLGKVENVIDAGAYIGDFAIFAVNVLGAKRVLALEPIKENRRILEENVALNGLQDRIEVLPIALSSSRGLTLHVQKKQFREIHASCIAPPQGAERRKVASGCLRQVMECFAMPHVDLVKMDIEGEEANVIRVLDKMTAQQIDHIVLEQHWNNGRDAATRSIAPRLWELGYDLRAQGKILQARRWC